VQAITCQRLIGWPSVEWFIRSRELRPPTSEQVSRERAGQKYTPLCLVHGHSFCRATAEIVSTRLARIVNTKSTTTERVWARTKFRSAMICRTVQVLADLDREKTSLDCARE
jgi:hypothetical protein